MKKINKVLKLLGILLLLLILFVIGYVAYVMIQYYRIDDLSNVDIENSKKIITLETNNEYSVSTYNIGFGAYEPSYSFFLDVGTMDDGTEVVGKYGKGISEERVLNNTIGAANVIKELDTDFTLLQEVDTSSTRSYQINQKEIFDDYLNNMANSFALNFHSSYSLLPLNDPHGSSMAGLASYSKFGIEKSIRHNYPVPETFPAKYFDLDRCFIANYIKVENGKYLVLVNSHMSAYDKGGLVRKKQLDLLNSFVESECKKGNYVIIGGDFNHALGSSVIEAFPSKQKVPGWVSILEDSSLTDCLRICKAENQYEVPTCRGADIPYIKGVTYTTVIDGFLISNNIEAICENINTEFEFSDHQPVKMKFKLK